MTSAVTDAVFVGVCAACFVSGDDGISVFFEATGGKMCCQGERRHEDAFAGAARVALDNFFASGLNERGEQGEIVGHDRCPDIRVEVREPAPGATPQPECALQA